MFKPTINNNVIVVQDKYVFADTSARDTYFSTHPTELVDNLYVYVTGVTSLYQYKVATTSWLDITPVIRGGTGATGATGADGADGTDGKTWYNGNGVPSNSIGIEGDFYMDTTNSVYYVKGASTWGTGISLVGATGADGTDGHTWYYGSGSPLEATGENGDFYLNTANSGYIVTGKQIGRAHV